MPMKPIKSIYELKMQRKNLKLQLHYHEEKLRQTANDMVYTYKFMVTQAVIKNALVSILSLAKKYRKRKKKNKDEDC